ncbi:MAG: right-handed parallel beta-helix repeat-containing protein, partial [Candidatus Aenigmarchaeota archaeon]|nr:right-handed parallel beta-helix repeat-containing protein [Candidatus Aenigmarchaeota archaeon]
VTDGASPLSGVTVFGNQTPTQPTMFNPTSNFSAITNSTGQIPTQILTEFMVNGTYQNNNTLRFTNYTVNASLTQYAASSAVVNLTESKSITISLSTTNLVCNLNTGVCNDTIQKAINNANNYDTISIVVLRDYNESIVINKSVTLTSNTSAFPTVFTDVFNATATNATINITASSVTISKVNVKYNGTGIQTAAISIGNATNVTIQNLAASTVYGKSSNYGIYLYNATNSTIANVTINANGTGIRNIGIYMAQNSNRNSIQNASVIANGSSEIYGIYLSSSGNNTISGSKFVSSGWFNSSYGAWLQASSGNAFDGVSVFSNGTSGNRGLLINASSTGNTFSGASIFASGRNGSSDAIRIEYGSDNNYFINATAIANTTQSFGIYIGSGNSTFIDANISSTFYPDIFLNGTIAQKPNFFINVSFNKSDVNATAASVATKLFIQYRFDATVTDGASPLSGVTVFGNQSHYKLHRPDTNANPHRVHGQRHVSEQQYIAFHQLHGERVVKRIYCKLH